MTTSTPERVVIDGCAIATMDDQGTEHQRGHIVLEGARITAVGSGPAPVRDAAARVDAERCLATPGLINTHHHLYQWLTRGMAQEADLFSWLRQLYPVWAHIDAEGQRDAARAGLLTLTLSGCSTSTDHHYVFPGGRSDLLDASIGVAREIGIRFHPCRGSMDLGESSGGLPPDVIVEDTDDALAATEQAIERYHDPSFGSMLQIGVAPCSPFSATVELMRSSAELARRKDVRLHTHLAETPDEDAFCLERFGMRPVDLVADLDWLGSDVWLAHCVHLAAEDIAALSRTSTGVAHCPSSNGRLGAGIAPARSMLGSGVAIGLGVDGAASNEAGEMCAEMRSALLAARVRDGVDALTARDCVALATRLGARCLGRESEIGSLEPGKLADVALWRLDTLGHAGITDPVTALVFGPPRRVHALFVNGQKVVWEGRHVSVDEDATARSLAESSRNLAERVGVLL
jgi:cytosine/adenosine deaminase-related metal-dependent hydrolase